MTTTGPWLARLEEEERSRQRARDPEAARAAQKTEFERRATAYEKRVAPLGTPVESAVERVLGGEGWSNPDFAYALVPFNDSFRPTAVRLARRFIRSDEQVLAALEIEIQRKRLAILVFTYGFAVKSKGKEFRVDREVTFSNTQPLCDGDPTPMMGAGVPLGDVNLHCFSEGDNLFDVLLLQASLQKRVKPMLRGVSDARRPEQRLIRSPRDAELVAAEWLTYFGFTNVRPTPVGADGGIDVDSDQAVAQVKAESIPVGRPKLQQHHGVAVAHRKMPIFFSLSGYTPQAQTYAADNGIILFGFNLQGEPEPANAAAHTILAGGPNAISAPS